MVPPISLGAWSMALVLQLPSGGSRILKGGVPLSTMFLTVLVHAHEASDVCEQNNKKGDSAEPKEPPWIHHCCHLSSTMHSHNSGQ